MNVVYCDVCGLETTGLRQRISVTVDRGDHRFLDTCGRECTKTVIDAVYAAGPGPGRDDDGRVGKVER